MRYFSLFTGIGGFELGIGPKHICMGYSEIDKYAIQIYQSHYPEHKNYGDITKIKTDDLPDFDLLVGGFPCQSFSIAGKRKGFNDTRGTLFFEIARILDAKKPRLFLLENVKGLLSHDDGKTFKTIITTLDELGYDLQWQLLNSKNHGVPQNRERIIIVGHLRGTPRPPVFPFTTGYSNINEGDTERKDRIDTITTRYASRNGRGTHIIYNESHFRQEGKLRKYKGISPTLNTAGGGGHIPLRKEGKKIRRLTPLECERLQGFPDNWTARGLDTVDHGEYAYLPVSDAQRYKTIGNAVTVNVIRDVMKKISKSESG